MQLSLEEQKAEMQRRYNLYGTLPSVDLGFGTTIGGIPFGADGEPVVPIPELDTTVDSNATLAGDDVLVIEESPVLNPEVQECLTELEKIEDFVPDVTPDTSPVAFRTRNSPQKSTPTKVKSKKAFIVVDEGSPATRKKALAACSERQNLDPTDVVLVATATGTAPALLLASEQRLAQLKAEQSAAGVAHTAKREKTSEYTGIIVDWVEGIGHLGHEYCRR